MGNDPSRRKLANLNKDQVNEEIKSYPVIMYSKPSCGYCKLAKDILEKEGIAYRDKDLNKIEAESNPSDFQAYVNGLVYLTRQGTVPQIFICGKFIGGYTELNKLNEQKKLWSLVNECSHLYDKKD